MNRRWLILVVATHGGGLTAELGGVAAGLVGGLAAVMLMRVYRSDTTGKPVSSAVVMLLARTAGLVIRSRSLPATGTGALPSPDHMLV